MQGWGESRLLGHYPLKAPPDRKSSPTPLSQLLSPRRFRTEHGCCLGNRVGRWGGREPTLTGDWPWDMLTVMAVKSLGRASLVGTETVQEADPEEAPSCAEWETDSYGGTPHPPVGREVDGGSLAIGHRTWLRK